MAFLVLDASRYQGKINWKEVKESGIDGAILKTVSTNYTEFGGLYIDPTFEYNYAECKKYDIPVGAYYYTYAQDKAYADKELALFKKAIDGKKFELPLVVDVEDNLLKPLSADALTDLVEYAAKTIQDWGCYAMVYTYLNYQNTELNMTRLTKYDLWLAAYRDVRPTHPKHNIWQFTSSGTVKGISGRCDLNYAYLDYPTIIKNAGLNGFEKAEPSKLSNKPSRLYIGPMSKGDMVTLTSKLDDMSASYIVTADGCIITENEISVENKIKIENEVNRLGNISIVDYFEVATKCEDCKELEAELIKLLKENEALKSEVTRLNDVVKAEQNTIQKIKDILY